MEEGGGLVSVEEWRMGSVLWIPVRCWGVEMEKEFTSGSGCNAEATISRVQSLRIIFILLGIGELEKV